MKPRGIVAALLFLASLLGGLYLLPHVGLGNEAKAILACAVVIVSGTTAGILNLPVPRWWKRLRGTEEPV